MATFNLVQLRLALLSVILLATCGCRVQGGAVADAPKASPAAASGETPQPATETWDVITRSGKRIGYSHTKFDTIEVSGKLRRQIVNKTVMSVSRDGHVTTQEIEMNSIESTDGELLQFDTSISDGRATVSMRGKREFPNMVIEITTLGRTQQVPIKWESSWGGFFAVEQSLERQPMKPGESRTIRAMMPLMAEVVKIDLRAVEFETTELLDGSRKLLKIERSTELSTTTLDSILWADEDGRLLKDEDPRLGQAVHRATKDVALQPIDDRLDLFEDTTVKVPPDRAPSHLGSKAVYRVKLKADDPANVFAVGSAQAIRSIDAETAEITVRALRPTSEADAVFAAAAAPTPADLASNTLIQADDVEVTKLANSIAPEETDTWKLACELERQIGQLVSTKDFSQALASAADVARSRQGDCTEHSVLLAAVCRARKIPARVAIGLVHSSALEGFAYHMWNEVWIDDRWIPMDATLARGGIGPAHIKVLDSDLSDASPFTAILPVVQVIGQLELEVVSTE